MKEYFHLSSDAIADRAAEVIQNLPHDGSLDVFIKEYKSDRSLKQHRLRWLWMTVYGGEHGITKDRSNKEWKYRFVLPILIRDDENGALKSLLDRAKGHPIVMEKFIDLIRASDMDMGQYSEALTEFDRWAGSHGIILPHPEDLYSEAIGR